MVYNIRVGAVPLSLFSVGVQVISNSPEVRPASKMTAQSANEGELIIYQGSPKRRVA
jgi:hypothetical protein